MKEEFILVRLYEFHSAHQLFWHKGKCSRIHGHSYKLEVHIFADKLNENGVVMDVHDIDEIVQPLIDELDHKYLNNILDNPTMENIARFIWNRLKDKLPLYKIVLWESSRSRIEYSCKE